MSRQQRSMLTLALITAFVGTALILPGLIDAENVFFPITVSKKDSADNVFFPIAVSKKNFAPAEKTGQAASYATGDDGELQKGVAWPDPRFTDNGNGTVTDNLTGLIWLTEANCISTHYPGFDNDGIGAGDGKVTWQHALDFVAGINAGTYPDCGAGFTDWRLPNINELHSLVHYGFSDPALPNSAGTGQWAEGNPFSNVQSYYYWSSTTLADFTSLAWLVDLNNGYVFSALGTYDYHVWWVRGGP